MNDYFKNMLLCPRLDVSHPDWEEFQELREAVRDELLKKEEILDFHDKQIRVLEQIVTAWTQDISDQADEIEYLSQRLEKLEPVDTRGTYNHLTNLQMNALIGVLKVYADPESWRVSVSAPTKPWFRNETERPWTLARKALGDLGL